MSAFDTSEAPEEPDQSTGGAPPAGARALGGAPPLPAAAPVRVSEDAGRLFTRPFIALLAMQGAYGFSFSMFFLLPKYLAATGEPPARIGFVMAGFGVACVLTIPFLRAIVETLGRRTTLIAANLLLASAAALFAIIDRPGIMAIPLRASEGVTWTLMFSTAIALTAELAPRDRLAQAIGLAGGASLIMNAVAPAIGEPLADHFGYRSAFFVAALSALAAAALARRLTIPPRALAQPAAKAMLATRSASVPVATTSGPGARIRLYAVFGVAGLAFSVLFTFLAPFALGRGVQAIRIFFIGYTSSAIAVRVLGGRLSDRLGHGAVPLAALVLYGCVVASTGLLGPHHLGLLGIVFGMAHGAAFPALMALLIQGTPPEQRPSVLGIANGAMSLGICAVFPAGMLAARVGYPLLFALVGGLTSLAAAVLVRARVRDVRERPGPASASRR
jgi:predicted MFS family arabinose efflux permease